MPHLARALAPSLVLTTPFIFSETPFPTEIERQQTFSTLAPQYDGLVRWTELTSGIGRWRKKLIRQAYGDVLEIGIGTGRNFKYYKADKLKSLTGVDFSRRMLEISSKKKSDLDPSVNLRLVCADARTLDEKFQPEQFDCVIDTFGLCSFEDPVAVLTKIATLIKPDGRLLLLEHGEADYVWINKYLRKHLHAHVSKYGCYHDRDIKKIVQDSGFQILEERKKHFGSIRYLICSKQPNN